MLTQCESCKTNFEIDGWAAKHRKRHFCSRACFKTYNRPPEQRFWPHVEITEDCWLWTGCLVGRDGRGSVRVDIRDSNGNVVRAQAIYAHRFSWELHNGPIPNGLFVLHKCDVPSCVNPSHLFLGTHADNMDDRNKKQRQTRGEKHPRAKLTEPDIKLIREMRHCGKTQQSIADFFEVSRSAVRNILNGSHWKHVP